MSNRKFIFPAIALAALVGGTGVAGLPIQQALAQAANPAPAAPPAPGQPQRPHREFRSHIDGRIAFLKAELKITPEQEAQWQKVAQTMRQNSQERRQSFEQMRANRDQPRTALQHLELQARMAATRAQQTDRFLAAFRPLYDSLSPDQKKAADDLMTPHHHFHRRGGI